MQSSVSLSLNQIRLKNFFCRSPGLLPDALALEPASTPVALTTIARNKRQSGMRCEEEVESRVYLRIERCCADARSRLLPFCLKIRRENAASLERDAVPKQKGSQRSGEEGEREEGRMLLPVLLMHSLALLLSFISPLAPASSCILFSLRR